MKHFFFLSFFLCIISINVFGSHTVQIVNETDKTVEIYIGHTKQDYYKEAQSIAFLLDSICSYSYDFPEANGTYFVSFKRDTDYYSGDHISFYNFLDDTLLITIKSDTIISKSMMGYDTELNYRGDSLSFKLYDKKKSISNFEEYVTFGKKCLEQELEYINKTSFKSKEIKEFLIETARMNHQYAMLDYIITKFRSGEKIENFDMKQAYDCVVDYDVINNPKYPNSSSYYDLLQNLFAYRKDLIHKLWFSSFRPSKGKAILMENLTGFGAHAMTVWDFNYVIKAVKSPTLLNIFKKGVEKEAEQGKYPPETTADMLAIVNKKLSYVKGEEFPIKEFVMTDGGTTKISSYKGKVLVIYFWSSGCYGCVKNTPKLKALMKELEDDNVELLRISVDIDEQEWQNTLLETKIPGATDIRVLAGFMNPDLHQLPNAGVPNMIVLDMDGNIYDIDYNGFSTKSIARDLRKLANKK